MKSKEIRSMDYVNGFKDAVSAFEMETNAIIETLENSDKATLLAAIDSFIATTYVAKLHADAIESGFVFAMNKEYEDCSVCDVYDECYSMNNIIETIVNSAMKEEF